MTSDATFDELSVLDAEILPERTVLSIADLIGAVSFVQDIIGLHRAGIDLLNIGGDG